MSERDETVEVDASDGITKVVGANVFNFDTGKRDYVINGHVVSFNPTDADFITRFNSMLKRLGVAQDRFQQEMKDAGDDSDKTTAALEGYCAKGREIFDGLFGEGASDGMFGGCSPFAVQSDTRLALWVILCDYISDVIADAILELPDEVKTDSLRANGAKSKALLAKYKIKR